MINLLFLLLLESKNNVISVRRSWYSAASSFYSAAAAAFLYAEACGSDCKSTECLLCLGVSKMVLLKISARAEVCRLVRKT